MNEAHTAAALANGKQRIFKRISAVPAESTEDSFVIFDINIGGILIDDAFCLLLRLGTLSRNTAPIFASILFPVFTRFVLT